ncbi:MAG: NDP-sugar synthase [Candidatus Saganbacteria bacterium]|nr:NDP-sugar synthase [Candidatus Saganbacteria bacterium]
MKAVIIAGGLGTRLRPLTYNTPKPIVPVANRAFVLHQIALLRQHGIDEVILNLHYLSDSIKQLLDDGKELGLKISYSIEARPLGTAGAVKNAEEFFGDGPLVVFNGDVLTDINIGQIIDYHKKKKARATLTLTRVEDPTAYGLILIGEDGRVRHFIEKPSWEQLANLSAGGPADTVNAGIYVLDPKIFETVPRGVEYSFERQLFPELLAAGEPVYGYVTDRYWIDIGKPLQYQQAHEAILRGEVAVKVSGTRTDRRAWLGDNCRLDKTVKLLGPVIIGRDVTIGPETRIKDYTVLGDSVTIGREGTLSQAIVWERTRIGNHVSLNGCLVGYNCVIEDNVVIGPGVVLADNTVVKRGSLLCSP